MDPAIVQNIPTKTIISYAGPHQTILFTPNGSIQNLHSKLFIFKVATKSNNQSSVTFQTSIPYLKNSDQYHPVMRLCSHRDDM